MLLRHLNFTNCFADIFSDGASQDSLEFCDDGEFSESRRCDCSARTIDEWDAPTQVVQPGDDQSAFGRRSGGGAEADKGGTEAFLCRDDYLEGAETVSEASAVESAAGRESSADNSADVSTESLAKSGAPAVDGRSGTKAPDGPESASCAQKRTMAVKDLSKGIYVASASNPKTENAADNKQSTAGRAAIDGSKNDAVLLQFPLLQSLVGRSNATSHQNV